MTWLEVKGLRIRCLTARVSGTPVLLRHGGGIDSAGFSYKCVIEPLALDHWVFAGLAGIRRERQTGC